MHCETSRKIIDSSNNAAVQAWKDQYVRSLVSVAGVWGGTARAVKVFAVGDNLDSWFLNEKNLLWERTNPSLAWLMPSADFWTEDEVYIKRKPSLLIIDQSQVDVKHHLWCVNKQIGDYVEKIQKHA